MRRYISLILWAGVILVYMIGCGQHKPRGEDSVPYLDTLVTTNDSLAIMQAFEQLKTDRSFLKDVGLESEEQFTWSDTPYTIIRGDLDGDSSVDVLLGFSMEGRGGGNNFDVHYVLLLNKENSWKYAGQLNASVFVEDRFLAIEKIENGLIKGRWLAHQDESLTPYSAEYIFSNGQLINTFTALHRTEEVEREYLVAEAVFVPECVSVPLIRNLKVYEQLLGKGKLIVPAETPDCGTYWEEGTYRFLVYPNLKFELNDDDSAVLTEIKMEKGFSLQTDKGTINANTRLQDLMDAFYKKDNESILDPENGLQIFAIPDGAESDNQWRFGFDKNGKLIHISLHIPC